MSTTATQNWQTVAQIHEQEFADGYWQESAAQSQNPTERDGNTEGAVEELQHTHGQTAASETTLWADGSKRARKVNNYDPSERLLSGKTKGQKYTRLWRLNAGHDRHRAGRKSREECHKADESKAFKLRSTEAVCNQAELSDVATERATDLAARNCPKRFNFIGGLTLWILACVVVAAEQHGEGAKLEAISPKSFFKGGVPERDQKDSGKLVSSGPEIFPSELAEAVQVVEEIDQ